MPSAYYGRPLRVLRPGRSAARSASSGCCPSCCNRCCKANEQFPRNREGQRMTTGKHHLLAVHCLPMRTSEQLESGDRPAWRCQCRRHCCWKSQLRSLPAHLARHPCWSRPNSPARNAILPREGTVPQTLQGSDSREVCMGCNQPSVHLRTNLLIRKISSRSPRRKAETKCSRPARRTRVLEAARCSSSRGGPCSLPACPRNYPGVVSCDGSRKCSARAASKVRASLP
mmetsp:Transcript_115421/g.288456  ORF Transcript_115421/g.288456 Transcript_115421/m.288456 type:complete len:228 (-) Transcript_115421:1085-1768(-)